MNGTVPFTLNALSPYARNVSTLRCAGDVPCVHFLIPLCAVSVSDAESLSGSPSNAPAPPLCAAVCRPMPGEQCGCVWVGIRVLVCPFEVGFGTGAIFAVTHPVKDAAADVAARLAYFERIDAAVVHVRLTDVGDSGVDGATARPAPVFLAGAWTCGGDGSDAQRSSISSARSEASMVSTSSALSPPTATYSSM